MLGCWPPKANVLPVTAAGALICGCGPPKVRAGWLAAAVPAAGNAAAAGDPPNGALLAGAEPPKLKLGAAAAGAALAAVVTEPVAAVAGMLTPKLGPAAGVEAAVAAAALPKEKAGAEAAAAGALLAGAAVAEPTAVALLSGFAVGGFEAPVVSALLGLDLVSAAGPKLKAGGGAGAEAGREGAAGPGVGAAPKVKPPRELAAAGWLGPAGKIANTLHDSFGLHVEAYMLCFLKFAAKRAAQALVPIVIDA